MTSVDSKLMAAFFVVLSMLIFCSQILESSPAVGVVGGVVSMNMTIDEKKNETLYQLRYLYDPNNAILLVFVYGSVDAADYTDPNVRYTGNISKGFVSFTLSNLTIQRAGIYQYFIGEIKYNTSRIAGEQNLIIAGRPSTPVITALSQPAIAGREYKLNCSAVSTSVKPGHNLTMFSDWKRNGTNITPDDSRYGVNETILTIRNLSKTDNNVRLTCIAFEDQHVKSLESDAFSLNVYYGPDDIKLSSSHMFHIVENSSLNVNCSADCVPNCHYRWTGPGVNHLDKTGMLSISKISRNQTGHYTCTAFNPNITSNSATTTVLVTVQYGARISNLSVHGGNTINEYSSAIFNCHVDSNPPSTITWKKEGSSAVLKTESGVVQSNYTIESADCLGMGNYTCSAENGISTSAKQRLELFVRCHPRTDFSLGLETKLYKKRYEEAILKYTVIAYPSPIFTWTFHGNDGESRVLPVSESQHDNGQQSELKITNLTVTDFGNYSVIANNSLNPSAMTVFEVVQSDVPEVPSYVEINEITRTSIKVQWMAGYNGGPTQTFHIVASAGSSSNNITADDPGYQKNGTAVLNGLLPGTKYSIYVVAINSVGCSNITQPIHVTTLKDTDISNHQLASVAGGIGAGVGVILVVALVVFLMRRYQHEKSITDEQVYQNATHDNGSPKKENVYEGLSNTSGENAYDTLGAPNGTCVEKDNLLYVNLMLNPLANKNDKPNIGRQNNQTEAEKTADGCVGESL